MLFWFAADSIRKPFDDQHAAGPALPREAPADGGSGELSIPPAKNRHNAVLADRPARRP
jgi:hypothetical protein